MSNKFISSNLKSFLQFYNMLPYVAIKRKGKHYILPHRPTRPKTVNFKIATETIKQHSEKYNQYFSSQKLWQKVAQKFQSQITDSQTTQQVFNSEFKTRMQEYLEKSRQYEYKYKQPLQILFMNAYLLFRKDQFRKKRQKEQLIKSEEIANAPQLSINTAKAAVKQQNRQTKKSKRNNSLANLTMANSMKLTQKWKKMSPQQQQIYFDLQTKLKSENQKRIEQFIENHQVPALKRYSVISRFIPRVTSILKIHITDKQIYKRYKELPDQEKRTLSMEVKKMNDESREKYQNFLRRWNLSKEQLNYIIQISDQYRKTRRQKFKEAIKLNQQSTQKFISEYDDEDYEQMETEDENST